MIILQLIFQEWDVCVDWMYLAQDRGRRRAVFSW